MSIKKAKVSEKKKTKTFDMKCFIPANLFENDEKSKSACTFIRALCNLHQLKQTVAQFCVI